MLNANLKSSDITLRGFSIRTRLEVSRNSMNVEVENLPNCIASLRIELPPDFVTKEWNEVVKGFRQVARIPGFARVKPRRTWSKRNSARRSRRN